jgi:hypothetical protein
MTMRSKRVTFRRPFVLKGLEDQQPSGTYSVDTLSNRWVRFPFLKAKRGPTWIRICRNPGIGGVVETIRIDSLDLAAALMRDALPARR